MKEVLQRVHPLAKFSFSPLLSTAVCDNSLVTRCMLACKLMS